ncbi:glycosyltransferase family 2 protein [Clostridium botulinum]|nr:glycosyltransferase family 2 protein [Clostridium botulinum]NFP01070.1 glycosyltransferase family 2 protein [Clostridium botulinum]
MEKLVYIILVNYNGLNDTIECLNSIQKSNYKNYKVLIIDNNSPDKSGIELKKRFSQYEFILNEENLGFAKANNLGYQYALKKKAEYILLLNNDTIIDSDMINELISNSNKNTITVPKMYYYNSDILWYAGGKISINKGTAYHLGEKKKDCKKFSEKMQVSFATGCCMLIHKDILKEIGLFDEAYFMYCEDFDFSLKLQKKSKIIIFSPKAKLWHKVNASTKNNSNISKYYLTRNRFYLLKKHKNYFNPLSTIYTYITRLIILMLSFLKKDDYKIYIMAWNDYKKLKMGIKVFEY